MKRSSKIKMAEFLPLVHMLIHLKEYSSLFHNHVMQKSSDMAISSKEIFYLT